MKGDTKAVNYLERIDIENGCNVGLIRHDKSLHALHFSSVYTTYLCSYVTDNNNNTRIQQDSDVVVRCRHRAEAC